jgi:hypothetical protein
MRVLKVGELSELRSEFDDWENIYPLPSAHITKPSLVIKAKEAAKKEMNWKIINREEVRDA